MLFKARNKVWSMDMQNYSAAHYVSLGPRPSRLQFLIGNTKTGAGEGLGMRLRYVK